VVTEMCEVEAEVKKSTHRVEIVPVILEKHGNADTLSVAKVFGYTCVTQTSQWDGKKLAAYLPPDSLVDVNRPEFAFLAPQAKSDGKARIKAKKIRGVLSFGLLVPAPEGSVEGDDVSELLQVEHYEPRVTRHGEPSGGLYPSGEVSSGPNLYFVKYDVESGRRYAQVVFKDGEPVVVCEKIHGASSRVVFHDGKLYVGSRTEWKKETPSYDHVTFDSLMATGRVTEEKARDVLAKLGRPQKRNDWWRALDATPSLRSLCENNPDHIVYLELYGAVQDLRYNHHNNDVSFRAFDIMKDGKWLNWKESQTLANKYGLPWVPIIDEAMPYDFDKICELAEGKSLIADHCREGVVVKTVEERHNDVVGRCMLKWVGAGYLERGK